MQSAKQQSALTLIPAAAQSPITTTSSRKGREYVGKRLERLRQLRNRVSHHENLLRVNLNDRMKDVATALNAIDPNCASWAFHGSRVRSVARADPRNSW